MPTVLVVDDEPNLCELYRMELEREGYQALVARSGAEALEIVQAGGVDVVVVDIAMPGMDGIELLARILAVNNQLPVILNTAYTSYQDDFMTWAAEAYVVKSHDPTELFERIAECLQKRGIAPPTPPDSQGS